MPRSLTDWLFGTPLASQAEEDQKVGVFAGIPMLGLDALSSAAYGPESALTILLPLGMMGLNYIGPISAVILALLFVLYFSYRQTISAYPDGGGSYTVASENLGPKFGLLAGAALLLDYVLNVAVGIAAGVGALVSAVPALHPHILGICLLILGLVAFVNLRGTRESGLAFAIPTYLFTVTLLVVLVVGVGKTILAHGHPIPVTPFPTPSLSPSAATVGMWILLRAFASGCTAMTGVEAVSNGVCAFSAPAVKNAQKTLGAIVAILGALLAGIAYVAHAYGIMATDPDSPSYQSILSMLISAVCGRGVFYYITIGGVLSVLCLSANTSFADFPRLCRLIARDDYLPHAFENRGRRLVYTLGISILTLFSALLLIVFGGITDRLIPLFAIGAFLAFTLSQAGMVVHWKRIGEGRHHGHMLVNGLGAAATAVALVIILVAKFAEGAWITTLIVPAFVLLFLKVRTHYGYVANETKCARPLDLSSMHEPIVIVPVKCWDTITEKGLRFALQMSSQVHAVHIGTDLEITSNLRTNWDTYVRGPLKAEGRNDIPLEVVESPYRRLFNPFINYISELKRNNPDQPIAVIVPELIETHWYQYPLHNQRAAWLKAALLLHGDRRVVVISVPWYVSSGAGTSGE